MKNKKLYIKKIEKKFTFISREVKEIIKAFHDEMGKGLRGKKSSLKMLPAFISRPNGNEKGKFIALDLGGTNFRVLELVLKGGRKAGRPVVEKFVLSKTIITGKGV